MEKDDCDAFIEDAERILQLYDQGVDVEMMTKRLLRHASLIDPSTCPPDFDPVNICNLLEMCLKPRSSTSPPPTVEFRQRHRFRSEPSPRNLKNQSSESEKSSESSSSRSSLRLIVPFFLILILCLLYYLQLPPPCPRPIW